MYVCMYVYIYMYIYIYIYILHIYAFSTKFGLPSGERGVTPEKCYGRFPKFHRVVLGRDPGTLKSDIVSKKHPQLICSDLRLSNCKFED